MLAAVSSDLELFAGAGEAGPQGLFQKALVLKLLSPVVAGRDGMSALRLIIANSVPVDLNSEVIAD